MKIGWPRPKHDQTAEEIAQQSARSKEVLERVDKVLDRAVAIIDDYSLADQERLRGGNRDPR